MPRAHLPDEGPGEQRSRVFFKPGVTRSLTRPARLHRAIVKGDGDGGDAGRWSRSWKEA